LFSKLFSNSYHQSLNVHTSLLPSSINH
jgi:hypothetical protein